MLTSIIRQVANLSIPGVFFEPSPVLITQPQMVQIIDDMLVLYPLSPVRGSSGLTLAGCGEDGCVSNVAFC